VPGFCMMCLFLACNVDAVLRHYGDDDDDDGGG